jgi:hypothetical protein
MFRTFEGKSLPMSATSAPAHTISVYDPAMCCSTGICGPGVDQQLLQVARYLRRFEAEGIKIERFNLTQQPNAFVENPRVAGLLQAFGEQALPVTLVNGTILTYGAYPSSEEISAALAKETASAPSSTQEGCGCEPGSNCC